MQFLLKVMEIIKQPPFFDYGVVIDELIPFFSERGIDEHYIISENEIKNLIYTFIETKRKSQEVMYNSKKPPTHNAIPSLLYTLPIASLDSTKGSLQEIDQGILQSIIERSGLRLRDVRLTGPKLCPKKDIPILTSIIQDMLRFTPEDFIQYDTENGKMTASGKILKLDYWKVLDKCVLSINKTSYCSKHYKKKAIIEEYRESIERISSLKLSWISEDNSAITSVSLIPYIQLDAEKLIYYVQPTYYLYKLFKDDRVLTLNRGLINVACSTTERTIMYYISGLKHEYETLSNKPIRISQPINIIDLIVRCYPSTSGELNHSSKEYKNKRSTISKAMANLRDEGLIAFDERTFGRGQKIYSNVVCYTGLKTKTFKQKYKDKPQKPKNGIKGYLEAYPLPKSKSAKAREEYADKHIDNIVSMAKGSDEKMIKAFSQVHKNTLKSLKGYADFLKNDELLTIIERVFYLRANKPEKLKETA